MLTFHKVAAGAKADAKALTAHLMEQTLPEADTAIAQYYLRTGLDPALADAMASIPAVRSDIDPALAEVLALTPGAVIGEEQLAAILSGRRADGEDIPGSQHKINSSYKTSDGETRYKISGMDLCFSAPKSVSVAWMAAKTEAERNSILQASRDARDTALRYIEQELNGRASTGGRQYTEAGKIGWIAIDHFTARPTIKIRRADPETGVMGTELYTLMPKTPGDPQLHHHTIVPNVMVTESGKTVAINTKRLHGRIHEFGAYYQACLAQNLRAIGIKVDLDPRTKMARLPVIPEAVCKEFSKRTEDAEGAARSAAAAQGQDWDAMPDDAKVAFLKGGANATRRYKTDDLANFAAWYEQAEAIGWKCDTAITQEPSAPHDLDAAFDVSIPLVEQELEKRSVIYGPDARLQALRGLIATGIRCAEDISAVTRRMASWGVRQDGKWTNFIWAEEEDGTVKITTALHKEQEEEVIELARAAQADTSRALSEEELDAAVKRTGIEFAGDHGAAQLAAMRSLGMNGALSVLIGVAGAGKTTLLKPLVDAYHTRGCKVWGISLGWTQAKALQETGVDGDCAIDPFFKGIRSGRNQPRRQQRRHHR